MSCGGFFMTDLRIIRGKWAVCSLWGIICILLLFPPVGRAEEQPWRIRINIPEYKLYLYQGNELYHEYPVAVGKRDSPSPTGNFTIINKVRHPTWYPPGHKQTPVPPGTKNPLGKYWLGLSIPGYGIHGNSAPQSIGSPVSLGCFRMRNQDIEHLFGLIPIDTPVEVVYQTVTGKVDSDGQAWLEVFPDIYRREKINFELEAVFNELHWDYTPHLKALQSLLPSVQRPGKVQAPRMIRIEGDIPNMDGFFWEGKVYISRNILASVSAADIPETGKSFWDGYLDVQSLSGLAPFKYEWNVAENTLFLRWNLPVYFP